MEAKRLNIETRKDTKKKATARLRRAGKIPAVVYGFVDPMVIAVDAREFRANFKKIAGNTIVELKLPEESHEVLIKDFQRDNLTGEILHIDFYEFKRGVALRTKVPIRLIGNPVGVKEGGILEVPLHELEVECLPRNLPEEINLDVSELALGHALHVSQIALPEGVVTTMNPDQTVCLVAYRKAEEEAAPAAAEGEVPAEGEAVEGEEKKEETEEAEEK
jgi:large subunit ribosomal protein L25